MMEWLWLMSSTRALAVAFNSAVLLQTTIAVRHADLGASGVARLDRAPGMPVAMHLDRKVLQSRVTAANAALAKAKQRIADDIKVISDVEAQYNGLAIPPMSGSESKVAFLFMVKDKIHQQLVWKAFFSDPQAAGKWNVYVHRYIPSSEKQPDLWKDFVDQGQGTVVFIPRVKTNWGQLAGVEVALFRAALQNPENHYFVLLSEGHVPFKSFGYVHDYIMAKQTSRICINKPEDHLSVIVDGVMSVCSYRDQLQSVEFEVDTVGGGHAWYRGRVRQHHQWVILNRQHALDVVNFGKRALQRLESSYEEYIATTRSGYDPVMLGANDETFVVIAILLASENTHGALKDSMEELQREGVDSDCTNFVYWRNCFKNTDLSGETGWGQGLIKNASTLLAGVWGTPADKWFDPQESPAKKLNDSPRDFGLDSAHPSTAYLASITSAGFLFGRKFGYNSDGQLTNPLDQVLPRLWLGWDSCFGERTQEALVEMSHRLPVLDMSSDTTRATLESCCSMQQEGYLSNAYNTFTQVLGCRHRRDRNSRAASTNPVVPVWNRARGRVEKSKGKRASKREARKGSEED